MRITTITYSRTINLGNFESKKLEATCDVDETEDPSEASDALRVWVLAELTKPKPNDGYVG